MVHVDSAPRGANTHGYIWVDRAASEYNVCVGWVNGSDPFPWFAYLNDEEPGNNREALVVVQFTNNGVLDIRTSSLWRAFNTDNGWGFRASSISNFYVGVCLHIPGSDTADHCGWESGARNYTTLTIA